MTPEPTHSRKRTTNHWPLGGAARWLCCEVAPCYLGALHVKPLFFGHFSPPCPTGKKPNPGFPGAAGLTGESGVRPGTENPGLSNNP